MLNYGLPKHLTRILTTALWRVGPRFDRYIIGLAPATPETRSLFSRFTRKQTEKDSVKKDKRKQVSLNGFKPRTSQERARAVSNQCTLGAHTEDEPLCH